MTEELDPEVRRRYRATLDAGRRPVRESTVAEARAGMLQRALASPPGPDVEQVNDRVFRVGPTGEVHARIYEPAGATPTIVYAHGGGWTLGSVEASDAFCRQLAVAAQTRVVSVEYRLAPEHPFPAGLEDLVAVTRDVMRRHPGEVVAIAGESAGGNLATVAARRLRDEATPVAAELLLYPNVEAEPRFPSIVQFEDALYPLSGSDLPWFWDHYVPAPADRGDPDVSPLRATRLEDMPPTLLVLAGHDPLRDEGLAYADRLRNADVEVEILDFPSFPHGFTGLTTTLDPVAEAVRSIGIAFRRFLRAPDEESETQEEE